MNFFDVLVSSIQDPQAGTQKSDLEGLLGALLGGAPATAQPSARQVPPHLAGTIGSVLKPSLLQSGARSGGAAPSAQTGATAGDPLAGLVSNPLLKGFLDSDGDGDVDMQDLVRLGSKFLQ